MYLMQSHHAHVQHSPTNALIKVACWLVTCLTCDYSEIRTNRSSDKNTAKGKEQKSH